MTKITINHKNHTIEMSKSAYKAATRFGSDVYEEVQKARAAYPTYISALTRKRIVQK